MKRKKNKTKWREGGREKKRKRRRKKGEDWPTNPHDALILNFLISSRPLSTASKRSWLCCTTCTSSLSLSPSSLSVRLSDLLIRGPPSLPPPPWLSNEGCRKLKASAIKPCPLRGSPFIFQVTSPNTLI